MLPFLSRLNDSFRNSPGLAAAGAAAAGFGIVLRMVRSCSSSSASRSIFSAASSRSDGCEYLSDATRWYSAAAIVWWPSSARMSARRSR